MTQINLSLKQKQTHRHRDQICGCQQGGRGEQGWTRNLELAAAAAAKSLQSCRILCDPIEGSPPGSPVPGILQARTLEWVAISFSNASKWKGKMKVKSFSRVWLFAPVDCSLPGSSAHGIFQARVLEWVAIAFSIGVGRCKLLHFEWINNKILLYCTRNCI